MRTRSKAWEADVEIGSGMGRARRKKPGRSRVAKRSGQALYLSFARRAKSLVKVLARSTLSAFTSGLKLASALQRGGPAFGREHAVGGDGFAHLVERSEIEGPVAPADRSRARYG